MAAEQDAQRSQQKTPTLAIMSNSSVKTNSALNSDDLDLFGFKPSNSSSSLGAKNPSLDIFDPYSSNSNQQKTQQSGSANLFAVNNTFGALPLPPSAANPINRQQPMMNTQSQQKFGNFQKSNPDPFDNLFSLKSSVQSPPNSNFGINSLSSSSSQAPVTKKDDPLDFLN